MLDSSEIAEIRREFPTLENWTHFALAHKAPLPRCAEDAIAGFLSDFYENAGKNAFDMERSEETRSALAALVGAPAHTLAFVKNTSEGINIFASGLDLGEGDEVIVSDLEHEANLLPWRHDHDRVRRSARRGPKAERAHSRRCGIVGHLRDGISLRPAGARPCVPRT